MAILQVRELPEPNYQELRRLARNEHRSLSQETAMVLARRLGLTDNPKERRRKLEIVENPLVPDGSLLEDPVLLIRQERDR